MYFIGNKAEDPLLKGEMIKRKREKEQELEKTYINVKDEIEQEFEKKKQEIIDTHQREIEQEKKRIMMSQQEVCVFGLLMFLANFEDEAGSWSGV